MVMRVTLALGGARATRGQACLKRRQLRARVRVGLAAEDAPGVNARVGAIEADPDAASQLGDIGLGEARVGADRARRGARGALVDECRERGNVGDEWTPMRSEDLFDAHLLSFGWMREASIDQQEEPAINRYAIALGDRSVRARAHIRTRAGDDIDQVIIASTRGTR